MDTVKTLMRSIAVIVLILFICAFFVFAVFGVRNILSQWELDQQLSEIDKQFINTRGQIPINISSEAFLPEQIGNFHRGSGINDYKCLLSDDGFPKPCFSTHYVTDSNDYQSRVWVTILRKSIKQNSALDDIFLTLICEEMTSKRSIRTVSNIPYFYGTCLGLFAPPELNEITWGNGDWFIEVSGHYDVISKFIAAYPY